ncbi:MAG: hypothetical protein JW910_11675, partial [Anaerolineae bacterium]|nr:hypothetical protein [Anaerolineae bacterium]
GERSLHRLIDTSASWEGSLRLRDWLAATTPDLERTRSRQALVRELAARAAFRDRLAYHARRASQGTFRHWEGERLQNWLSEHALSEMPSLPLRGLTLLAAVNAILFIVAQAAHTLPFWALTFLPYVGWYLWKVWELRDPFETSLALLDPLNDLRAVFETLETYGYGRAERLRELCAPFLEHDRRPSDEVRRLTRVLAAASLRGNPLLWMLISMILPWDVYVACWLNKRRVALGALLPGWLDRWFELEALNGLATLAYLNPDYTYPEWIEDEVQVRPVFEARELGHPLIPEDRCVCNDFSLDALGEMALISGSNMSGKSTFLRTLGVNLCLANAGAPVNARLFRAVPFRLFSCIRVTDSVTDGISYFYAEVKRLKALLMALQQDHPFPLFFLIDEIFRGTNNRERMIGSRSYIRALVGQHGTGAISTHDLELVKLADELARIVNYHFAETIADGRMLFDYTLRAGPCPTTNALRIMRMEGLPVEPAGPDS